MVPEDWIISNSNRIENFVNELAVAGHTISDLEKKGPLLRGLRYEFIMTAKLIRSTGRVYQEAISQLIIHQSGLDDVPEKHQAMVT